MKIDSSTRALVTGANGGIGAAIARALHRAGARLVLSGRREDALAPLAAELGAEVVIADQARPEDVERLCDASADVDVAVLNAAHPGSGLLSDYLPSEIDEIVGINLLAPVQTVRALAPRMASRGRGQIVMISSISGMVAAPRASLYSATKFGLRGFALSLRADLAPHGVGVTTIFPGFIRDAGMFANTGVELPRGLGTRSPEDVARAVVTAVRRNPAEIKVAALDQRIAAFASAVAPGLVDFVSRRLPMANALAADIARGHERRLEARSAHPPAARPPRGSAPLS